ncbi:MAG: hypothetical protein ABEI96_01555 [Haloarculaceae archaeon]
MATVDRPSTHRGELSVLVEAAGSKFVAAVALITLGAPIVAYLSGDPRVLFYVHIGLGAFWFGLDFFFKFVLGPALDAASDDASNGVNQHLVPKMVAVAEPLSVGVIGSGIALAGMMGYWDSPTLWLWAALGIGTLMLLIGFGPLHIITTRMAVEFSLPDPDQERLDQLFGKAMQWGLLQTVLMLAIIAAMTGLRWGI